MHRFPTFVFAAAFGAATASFSFAANAPVAALATPSAHAGSPTLARLADEPMSATAVAKVQGAGANKDKITGTVTFTQEKEGVHVVADIDGLTPGEHGFHVHEKPDLSAPDLSSAGGHFNPEHHKHGGPESEEHHAGDLGNLTADEKGHAHLDKIFTGLAITGKLGVVGHSVIIHAKADDLKSQPAGESGKRVAGGAIEEEKAK